MSLARMLCRFLIPSLALLPLEDARAHLIGTESAIAPRGETGKLLASVLRRPEAIRQLAALGVDQQAAEARVAAMTDEESRVISSQIAFLAAGGQMAGGGGDFGGAGGGGALLLLIVLFIAFLVWWSSRARQ